MAGKKSNTSTRTAGKTRIPASERKAVTQYRGWMIAEGKKHVTDEQAHRLLLKGRKDQAAELAKQQAEEKTREKEQKRETRERAIEALRHGIMHLADVRSLLSRMEYGEDSYFTPEAQATFARATLSDAATEMEQALFDLGLLNREPCGFFVPDLAEQSEAQVTA